MTCSGTTQSFSIHVGHASSTIWSQYHSKKPPNLYVEIQVEGFVMQSTRVVKRTFTPFWNEDFPLSGGSSSILSLWVRNKTLIPFTSDPCVGYLAIELSMLLARCAGDEDAILELTTIEGGGVSGLSTVGLISVRLSASNTMQATGIATANARQDVSYSDVSVVAAPAGSSVMRSTDHVVGVNPQDNIFVKTLGRLLSKLDIFVTIVDKTSKVHPYVNFAWQVTSSLYRAVQGQLERDNQLIDLVTTMENVYSFVDTLQEIPNKLLVLENVTMSILKQTVECAIFVREYTGHGFAGRLARHTFSSATQIMSDLSKALLALKESFDTSAILQAAFVSSQTLKHVENLVQIEDLKRLHPAHINAASRPHCLPDTRQDILKSIIDWLTSPSPNQNILWLHGLAGSGKSTVSATVAEYFRGLDRLGAFLFFDRNDTQNHDPYSVVRTLAHKLAYSRHFIGAAIGAAIQRNPGIVEAPILTQFTKLILEPLGSLPELQVQGPIVIIFDALDECGDRTTRKALLKLLGSEFARLPPVFRILVTSRREFDIDTVLSRKPNIAEKDIDITDSSNTEDIESYLRYHLVELRVATPELPPDWPGEINIQHLLQSSAGLFIWAATAIKFIENGYDRQGDLEILLSLESRSEAESALNTLYETALESAGVWDREQGANDFRAVLGAVVVGQIPLTDAMLDGLFELSGSRSSRSILPRLRCLLQWTAGGSVRTLHASFADYLSDARRSGGRPWFIDKQIHHRNLANACLRIMKVGLHFNMCSLETSYLRNKDVPGLSSIIEKNISGHLAYACCHWIDHLVVTTLTDRVHRAVADFLYNQSLYWLEVLSLLTKTRIASRSLLLLMDWIADRESKLSTFAKDINKFVSAFGEVISQSVPHIYMSALPFSPQESLVSKKFSPLFLNVIQFIIGTTIHWPAVQKVLDKHTDPVTSVAFSPDGKHVVSGSWDSTIRIWDAETGEAVHVPFEGHSRGVISVAFSPDGKHIISGSADRTIRTWDAETGEMVSAPFEGHSKGVNSVAYSPDGKHIVSASWDSTIRVWDAEMGGVVSALFEGHSDYVNSVAFSPDGKYVVSGSEDRTIRVWDANTGEVVSVQFEGHSKGISSVSFSPDGKRILSASRDSTIRLWDADTGEAFSAPFEGHSEAVCAVAFSPAGKHVVSASWDSTIRVWDAETGKMDSAPLEGHSGRVNSVAFSLDGKHIVSGSDDKTIRLWDADRGEVISAPYEGHSNHVTSIAFSPDGMSIVSGSEDRTIRVWDAETGEMVSAPFVGHSGGVNSVAFSPDGKHIVSGSEDKTIRMWAAGTGGAVSELFQGHTEGVNSVAFSPDGNSIVSGSWDSTVRVWDAEMGAVVSVLFNDHSKGVSSVAFSPDGKHVVSGTSDSTIWVWDVETSRVVSGPFEGHYGYVISVSFSPDGRHIISGSLDSTIRVWDAETGKTVSAKDHFGGVSSVAISPDGRRIVSASWDSMIRVWDAEMGELESGPFGGHSGYVSSIAFSPDGKRFVSGSEDKTIRIWDVEKGEVISSPFEGHSQVVSPVSPDGIHAVSKCGDEAIHINSADTEELVSASSASGFHNYSSRAAPVISQGNSSNRLSDNFPSSTKALFKDSSQIEDGWTGTSVHQII